MASETKPANINKPWAESGAITNPGDTKITEGWVKEKPDHTVFNYDQNRLGRAVKYLNERGIAEWDAQTEYPQYAFTLGSDGSLYQAVNANQGEDPTSSADWEEFGGSGLPPVGAEGDVLTTVSGAWTAQAPNGGGGRSVTAIANSDAKNGALEDGEKGNYFAWSNGDISMNNFFQRGIGGVTATSPNRYLTLGDPFKEGLAIKWIASYDDGWIAQNENGTTRWAGQQGFGQACDNSLVASETASDTSLLPPLKTCMFQGGMGAGIGEDTHLYTWGRTVNGTLGDGTTGTTTRTTPTDLGTGFEEVKLVRSLVDACGVLIARKSDGTLWGCGLRTNGILGDGQTSGSNPNLTQIPIGEPVTSFDVAGGVDGFTAGALGVSGTPYLWGKGSQGQMGNGTTTQDNPSPLALVSEGTNNVNIFVTGQHNSSVDCCNVYLVKSDNSVKSWGRNRAYSCGVNDQAVGISTPLPCVGLLQKPIKQIKGYSDSARAVACIYEDGDMFMTGDDNVYKLAGVNLFSGQTWIQVTCPKVSELVPVGSAGNSGGNGNEHNTMILSEDTGRAYVTGEFTTRNFTGCSQEVYNYIGIFTYD